MDGLTAAITWPFLACLLMAGLFTYLGARIIERRVIFAGLAMTQLAGLGAVWGVLMGWTVHDAPWAVRGFATGFTLVGAVLLVGLRSMESALPRESIAASLYAVAAGGTLLVAVSLHHGADEVRDLLAGSVVWIRPTSVLETAVVFALIAAALVRFRVPMGHADRSGGKRPTTAAWELAFYGLLGVAVSQAVPLVGVLLVFAYLLLPASAGMLLARSPAAQLRAGWITAALATLAGCVLSYAKNLPTEPTLVVCLGAGLGIAALRRYVASARDRLGAAIAALSTTTVLVLLLGWSFQLAAREEQVDAGDPGASPAVRIALIERLETSPALWASERPAVSAMLAGGDFETRTRLLELIGSREQVSYLDDVHALLSDDNDLVRESALACVTALARPESADPLAAAGAAEPDEFLRVEVAAALLALDDPRGTSLLLDVMEHARAAAARRDAYESLPSASFDDLDFDPEAGVEQRSAVVAAYRERAASL